MIGESDTSILILPHSTGNCLILAHFSNRSKFLNKVVMMVMVLYSINYGRLHFYIYLNCHATETGVEYCKPNNKPQGRGRSF